jgi:hypothetical protein
MASTPRQFPTVSCFSAESERESVRESKRGMGRKKRRKRGIRESYSHP